MTLRYIYRQLFRFDTMNVLERQTDGQTDRQKGDSNSSLWPSKMRAKMLYFSRDDMDKHIHGQITWTSTSIVNNWLLYRRIASTNLLKTFLLKWFPQIWQLPWKNLHATAAGSKFCGPNKNLWFLLISQSVTIVVSYVVDLQGGY